MYSVIIECIDRGMSLTSSMAPFIHTSMMPFFIESYVSNFIDGAIQAAEAAGTVEHHQRVQQEEVLHEEYDDAEGYALPPSALSTAH
jgi:hypothetical protein